MAKTISIADARGAFSELVNRVAYGGERYVVERRGKPMAALISAAEYQQLTALLAKRGLEDEVGEIPVHVRLDGDQYFVSDEALDLYGVGKTLQEAREDYWQAAQDYYADLSANADRLAPHLEEHLRMLREIFANQEVSG